MKQVGAGEVSQEGGGDLSQRIRAAIEREGQSLYEELANAVTHGIGAVLSAAALALIVVLAAIAMNQNTGAGKNDNSNSKSTKNQRRSGLPDYRQKNSSRPPRTRPWSPPPADTQPTASGGDTSNLPPSNNDEPGIDPTDTPPPVEPADPFDLALADVKPEVPLCR